MESIAGDCTWIVTSLPRADALDDVVGAVVSGRRAQLRGVIETSTFSVEQKARAAAELSAVGVALVDAPLSGTSQQAAERDLVAYVSGAERDCAESLPIIKTFTRAQYLLGALGNGTRMKLVANLLVAIHNVAAAEALVFAARAGLDLDTVVDAVSDGAGTSRMFEVRGPLMARRDFAATMRVDNFVKDVTIIEAHARSMGVESPLLRQSADLYRELLARGLGHLDTAAVFELLAGEDAGSEQSGQS